MNHLFQSLMLIALTYLVINLLKFQVLFKKNMINFIIKINIKERLSKNFIVLIIDELCSQGKTEWKNPQSKENFFIYTKSLKEIGISIYKWVRQSHYIF